MYNRSPAVSEPIQVESAQKPFDPQPFVGEPILLVFFPRGEYFRTTIYFHPRPSGTFSLYTYIQSKLSSRFYLSLVSLRFLPLYTLLLTNKQHTCPSIGTSKGENATSKLPNTLIHKAYLLARRGEKLINIQPKSFVNVHQHPNYQAP